MDRAALREATVVEMSSRLRSDPLQALDCDLLCGSELSADYKYKSAVNIQVPTFTHKKH